MKILKESCRIIKEMTWWSIREAKHIVILVYNIISFLEAKRTKGKRKKGCVLIAYDFDSSRKPN